MSYKDFVASRIENIKDSDLLTFQAAQGLAPWLVPIAPALVFGWMFYNATKATMGGGAIVGGVAIAIGLVVAGAMTSHTAITLQGYGVEKGKVIFAWCLVIAYVTLEIGGLLAMKFLGSHLEVVGIVASLLTLTVYLARSSATRLTEEKQMRQEAQALAREDAQDDKAWQRELELKRLAMEQEQAMARIEASKEKAIAKLSVPKTVSSGVPDVSQVDTNLSQNGQKQAILDALRQNRDTNVTQFCDTYGMSRSTFYRRIDDLKREGKIKVNGQGYEVLD